MWINSEDIMLSKISIYMLILFTQEHLLGVCYVGSAIVNTDDEGKSIMKFLLEGN